MEDPQGKNERGKVVVNSKALQKGARLPLIVILPPQELTFRKMLHWLGMALHCCRFNNPSIGAPDLCGIDLNVIADQNLGMLYHIQNEADELVKRVPA